MQLTRMERARQVVAHRTDPNQAFVEGKSMAMSILQRTFQFQIRKRRHSVPPDSREVIHG